MLGFKRPILHGLCSYGTAAHAVIKHMAGNEAARFKSIHARFSSPVYPGGEAHLNNFGKDSLYCNH